MIEKHVKRYSLSRQVADQLEKMIVEGVWAVGDKIPTEPELTEMFGVSRNTLREAVQSLTAAGILLVKQGDGTYVQSNNRFHANMNRKYEQVSHEDILEARNALEITIAYLASQRRTAQDVEDIRQALELRQHMMQKAKENTKADIQFHQAIAQACHNSILIDLYGSVSTYMEGHIAERQAKTDMDQGQIDKLHEDLYESICKMDPEAARVCAQNILKI